MALGKVLFCKIKISGISLRVMRNWPVPFWPCFPLPHALSGHDDLETGPKELAVCQP